MRRVWNVDQHCNVQLSGVAFRNREGLCYGRLRSLWRHRPFADVDVDVDVATQLLAYIEWLPPMLVDGTTEYAHLKQLPVVHHFMHETILVMARTGRWRLSFPSTT